MVSLTEKYCPKHLADFAGLENAKKLLAALQTSPWESAWLLVGDSGTGKTTMALAFAAELEAEVHHIASRQCDLETVERTVHLCFYTPWNGGWHVVITDEADQMSHAAQLCFLSKLDGTDRPPNTIFIFTANETKLLEKRFLSRCRIIRFEGCRDAAAGADLLRQVWQREASGRPALDFTALLQRNEFNLRSCLNEIEMEILAPGSLQLVTPPPPASNVTEISNPRRAAALKAWETIRAKKRAVS